MWKNGRYMQDDAGGYTPLNPNGLQEAGVYWEDVSGLVKSVALDTSSGTGENSKLRIYIDQAKSVGNASIYLKVDGKIAWTWHIWVTDNPENGPKFAQGFETDINGVPFRPQYMDRNLGAGSASFLGYNWQKSGGLMYQWGRKDPFPPLVYKDLSFYQIEGDAGIIRHGNAVLQKSPITLKKRGADTQTNNINGNIRYSVNHPLDYIYHDLNSGTWFSSSEYRLQDSDTSKIETWDLWSDNAKGKDSNASSSDPAIAGDSKSYEMKSEYDPCPNGWRVPSHYGRNTLSSSHNPYGRVGTSENDDSNVQYSQILPNSQNPYLPGVKVYPGLGIDFSRVPERNLGLVPTAGNYEYYGPEVFGANSGAAARVVYQDQSSDTSFHTATYGIGGERETLVYSSPEDKSKSATGWNAIYVNQTNKTNSAIGLRCMRDPNMALLPEAFSTEFILAEMEPDYKSWTKEPNSFVVMTGDENDSSATDQILKISLKKAYAMHKLYLSENHALPQGQTDTPEVLWTTNPQLIKKIVISGQYPDQYIEVTVAAKQKGNAVVAFHKGDRGVFGQTNPDRILWSWHIWSPVTNPLDASTFITYTTESDQNGGIIPGNSQFVDPTKSMNPPLTTTFMDRNLGALYSLPGYLYRPDLATEKITKTQIQQSGGMQYQWGRKDPMPSFYYLGGTQYISAHPNSVRMGPTYSIYRQTGTDTAGNVVYNTTKPISDDIFRSTDPVSGYAREWSTVQAAASISVNEPSHLRVLKAIRYSVENPLSYMFRNRTGVEIAFEGSGSAAAKAAQVKDWLSDENGLAQDRWGHGAEKSPYDPCPDGWRVPDTSSTALFAGSTNGSYAKGSSPWFYNGYNTSSALKDYGIPQPFIADLTGSSANNAGNVRQYPGYTLSITTESTMPSSRTGFVFNFSGSKFNIGNIPVTGVRGIMGGNDWLNPQYLNAPTADNRRYQSGLWTSSPSDNYTGYAIGLNISSVSGYGGKLATGTGFYPQAAMPVRCAKDTERYMGDHAYSTKTTALADTRAIVFPNRSMQLQSDIAVFPNPFKDNISTNYKGDLNYEIYDMSGRLMQHGETEKNSISTGSLPQGLYLLKLTGENITTIKKIIKK